MKLTWNKINKCTAYDVYIKENGTSKYMKVASTGAKKNTYTIKKIDGKNISTSNSYSVCVVAKKKVKGIVYQSKKTINIPFDFEKCRIVADCGWNGRLAG